MHTGQGEPTRDGGVTVRTPWGRAGGPVEGLAQGLSLGRRGVGASRTGPGTLDTAAGPRPARSATPFLERALPECEAQGASQVWRMVWLQMGLAQLCLALGQGPAALTAARRAADSAERSHFRMEQGAALRVLDRR